MEKRLLYAVLLSILFLFAWGYLAPRFLPEAARRPVEQSAQSEQPAATPAEAQPASEASAGAEPSQPQSAAVAPAPSGEQVRGTSIETAAVERPGFRATFTNRGAQLVSFILQDHQTRAGDPVELVEPREASRIDFPFALVSDDPAWNRYVNSTPWQMERSSDGRRETIRFTLTDPSGYLLEKSFAFGDDRDFDFSISSARPDHDYRLIVGPGIRAPEPGEQKFQFSIDGDGLIQQAEDLEMLSRNDVEGLQAYASPRLIGLHDNYFVTALRPTFSGEATLSPVQVSVPAAEEGKQPTLSTELYAGLRDRQGAIRGKALFLPKEAELLDRYELSDALNLGFFGMIARGLLIALNWIYDYTLNYGWAIVLLTIAIKLVLYPLQHKSMVSMKKMQKVQPKMNAIKEKYKKARTDLEQRQKMNQEMMQLYQREGINPMSGCFPILLQLPILWAFYSLLSTAIELRGADWILWITDLSAKDPYYITPILMTVTMFIQQLLTPMTGDPMQRRIFLLMPIIFGWIFKEFPSGLVLYWLVQNVLTIIQQMILNRYWKEHPEKLAKARG